MIAYEVIFEHTERPTLIIAALLMMGISVPLNLDEKLAWIVALTANRGIQPTEPEKKPEKVEAP